MSKKDSNNIEGIAVRAVQEYFSSSSVVDAEHLKTGDKELAWDGELHLFKNGEKKKENLIGTVPTQVKGKTVNVIKENGFSYKIKVIDLKAYLHKGTAYFVVQEVDDKRKVFCRMLTPLLVRNILKSHEGQHTVSVNMEPVGEDVKEFENKLIEFYENCIKQVGTVDGEPLDFNELKTKGISSFSLVAAGYDGKQNIADFLSQKSVYLYADIDKEHKLSLPIGEGECTLQIEEKVPCPISVAGEVFFESFNRTYKKDEIELRIGNCLWIHLPRKVDDVCHACVDYKMTASLLKEAIVEAKFILAIKKNNSLTIGDNVLTLSLNSESYLKEMTQALDCWERWNEVLDFIGCHKELDLKLVSDTDGKTLDLMYRMIIGQEAVRLKQSGNMVHSIQMANLHLMLLVTENSDGKNEMFNLFDPSIVINYNFDDGSEKASLFALLKKDDFAYCDNILYDDIVPSFKNLNGDSEHVRDMANACLLQMLHAVDATEDNDRKEKLLESCRELGGWLCAIEQDDCRKLFNKVNEYQVIKRIRELSPAEKMELKRMMIDGEITALVKAGVALLLDDVETSNMWLEQVHEDERCRFEDFPICHFRKAICS